MSTVMSIEEIAKIAKIAEREVVSGDFRPVCLNKDAMIIIYHQGHTDDECLHMLKSYNKVLELGRDALCKSLMDNVIDNT